MTAVGPHPKQRTGRHWMEYWVLGSLRILYTRRSKTQKVQQMMSKYKYHWNKHIYLFNIFLHFCRKTAHLCLFRKINVAAKYLLTHWKMVQSLLIAEELINSNHFLLFSLTQATPNSEVSFKKKVSNAEVEGLRVFFFFCWASWKSLGCEQVPVTEGSENSPGTQAEARHLCVFQVF